MDYGGEGIIRHIEQNYCMTHASTLISLFEFCSLHMVKRSPSKTPVIMNEQCTDDADGSIARSIHSTSH
jgi:hypothetical protein